MYFINCPSLFSKGCFIRSASQNHVNMKQSSKYLYGHLIFLFSVTLTCMGSNHLPPLWCPEPSVTMTSAFNVNTTNGALKYGQRFAGNISGGEYFNKVKFCYEYFCCCSANSANCSGTQGRLRFIPELNESILHLFYENNSLQKIDDPKFFMNITQIVNLSLAFNNLVYIHPDSFLPLKNLIYLNLEQNGLKYEFLAPVLTIHSLRSLDVRSNKLRALPTDFFRKSNASKLSKIFLQQNEWEVFNLSTFQPVKRLNSLALSGNRILHIHPDLLCLRKLDLMDNFLFKFPVTCGLNATDICKHNGTRLDGSWLPVLRALLLKGNRISFLPNKVCLPSLKLLDLGNNKIFVITKQMFNQAQFPILLELFLENMDRPIKTIEARAFSIPSLQRISLLYNAIDFMEGVHPDAFVDCPLLHSIQLSHNIFIDVTDKQFQNLFGNLTWLHSIYLEDCQVKAISSATFQNLKRLRTIILGNNKLTSLPDGLFDHLPRLDTLDLNSNDLAIVQEAAFSEDLRRRLTHLDLSGNPFSCSCDLLWFRNWLLSNMSACTKRSRKRYLCDNLENEYVTTFVYNEQACLLGHVAYVFMVVSVGVLLFTLSLIAALFRYRWHIRLVFYEIFRGPATRRRLWLQTNRFLYDAFVSYAAEDVVWVRAHLIPELEERLGLKLCIHQRDFLLGENIVDNISRSVQCSKKIILVFSTYFARSHWCQFELALCLRHVMEQDDQLVVVCLHELMSRDMTSIMLAVLKTTTYIDWGEEPDARASFWGRMNMALHEIIN